MNVYHYVENKTLLFEITEEIDHHETEKLRRKMDYEIQRLLPERVVFDMHRVVFMDSAAIGLLLGRYKKIAMYGGILNLANVSEKIIKIFNMSGILKLTPIIDLDELKIKNTI